MDEKSPVSQEQETDINKVSKRKSEIYDWLQCIVIAILACVLIFVFVAREIGVEGSSMEPTLQNNDKIFISNLFYTPSQGDVIVFRKDTFKYEPLVKRIIAVGGQIVDIDFEAGEVSVDGVVLQEDYINEITREQLNFVGPVEVPEGCVFVLGDNRNRSSDSRDSRIGVVDERYIMGKVIFRILPLRSIGTVS